jgi:hypothetical protein
MRCSSGPRPDPPLPPLPAEQVEEAVCAHAEEFIGTRISSVTQDIGYLRLAAGMRRNLFFEDLRGLC